jgi:hypothetical protein
MMGNMNIFMCTHIVETSWLKPAFPVMFEADDINRPMQYHTIYKNEPRFCLLNRKIDQFLHIHYCQSLHYLCLVTTGMYNHS